MSRVVKRRPKLKSKYRQCVEATIEYVKTIDDFDDLVDPRTLALYCLGPEPSAYFWRTIKIKEKKSKYLVRHCLSLSLPFFFFNKCFPFAGMTTKFNQGMYVKLRAKKNEPLSNLGKRTVCVVEKGVSITPATLVIETTRIASLATSVEEITPFQKK